MSTINAVHTPCKNCVFAIYDNITQTNCALHYLDIYRDKDIEILEAYDNDKEFYIINNKKCIGYREQSWFDNLNMSESSLEEKIKTYIESNHISYSTVVNLRHFTIQNFKDLLENLNKPNIKPQKLILIRHLSNKEDFGYSNIEKILSNYHLSFPWRIETILDSTTEDLRNLYTTITTNVKNRFVHYISDPSAENLAKLIDKANHIVYSELGQFNILSLSDKTSIIFSRSVYKYFINYGQDILEHPDDYTII